MEISPRIQISNLNPSIRSNIINFTFIHRFWWQRRPNCKNLTFLFFNQYACQCMSSTFKQHISSLNQSLFHKLITAFCSLARFSTSCEKNPAFFVFNTHKVCRYFNVNDVRPVTMTSKVVHKQIMCIINKKVQGVQHFFIITNERHFQILIDHFFEFLFRFVFFMD